MIANVTFAKSYAIEVEVPPNSTRSDIEQAARDKMIMGFINGRDYEPDWEMTDLDLQFESASKKKSGAKIRVVEGRPNYTMPVTAKGYVRQDHLRAVQKNRGATGVRDARTKNAVTFDNHLTPAQAAVWVKNPGRYDVKSIDSPKGMKPTAVFITKEALAKEKASKAKSSAKKTTATKKTTAAKKAPAKKPTPAKKTTAPGKTATRGSPRAVATTSRKGTATKRRC